jgi:hypothetical protein
MQFDAYLHLLADALGEAQLPINPGWTRAAEIVRADAVHYPLLKRVVAGVYKEAGCSKGSDTVELDHVLDCLGHLKYALRDEGGCDLDAVELIERIGEISVGLFRNGDSPEDPVAPEGPVHRGLGRNRGHGARRSRG